MTTKVVKLFEKEKNIKNRISKKETDFRRNIHGWTNGQSELESRC